MRSGSHLPHSHSARVTRRVALILICILGLQSSFVSVAGQRAPKKSATMTADQRVAHVLSRLTFGARPGDFEKVKAMGVEAFINQQLDPDSIDNSAVIAKLRRLPTLGMATPVIIEQYTPPKPVVSPSPAAVMPADRAVATSGEPKVLRASPPLQVLSDDRERMMQADKKMADNSASMNSDSMKAPDAMSSQQPGLPAAKPSPPPKNPQMVVTELQRAKLLRAVYSDRQLYELMVDFWENHFSIFANKDDDRFLLTGFDRETIRPFAMGRFRDLLGATAHSPAMLFYLDNWRSSVPRPYPAKGDKPAGTDGGLNENYARELMELHTLGVDGGYTQKDVQEVARCFSGWTIQKPNEQGLFLYRPGLHDDGEKVVLGQKILAGGGIADGERVLDILAKHPSTAKFIATKLARRFVSDDPPQSVIDRAVAVFLKTDGSIRETLRTIVTSPEFFSAAAYRAKVRSPFEYVAAAMRSTAAETDGDRPVLDFIGRMGQPLFGRITPDGYPDRGEQWLSSGAMVARLNFAAALATNRLRGTTLDFAKLVTDADKSSKDAAAARLMSLTTNNELSDSTRAAIKTATMEALVIKPGSPPTNVPVNFQGNGPPPPPLPQISGYVPEMIALLIGSPEFQRR